MFVSQINFYEGARLEFFLFFSPAVWSVVFKYALSTNHCFYILTFRSIFFVPSRGNTVVAVGGGGGGGEHLPKSTVISTILFGFSST